MDETLLDIAKYVGSAIAGGFATSWKLRGKVLDDGIAEVIGLIEKFEADGCKYWDLQGPDPDCRALAVALKRSSTHIQSRIAFLNSRFRMIPKYQFQDWRSLYELRRAAMGGPFEVTGRNADPEKHKEIQIAAATLINAVRRSRRV